MRGIGVGAVMRGELIAYYKKQKETCCRTKQKHTNSPQGALHASLLIRIGKLARDEHLLLRDDFERLGDEVRKRPAHLRLELTVVLFFEGGVVEVDGDVGVFLGALHD